MGIGWRKWRVGYVSYLGWILGCFVSVQIWAVPAREENARSKGIYWRKIAQKIRTMEKVMEELVVKQLLAAKVDSPAPQKNPVPQNKTALLSISAAGQGGKNVKILNRNALKLLPKIKFASKKIHEKVSKKNFEKTSEKISEKENLGTSNETIAVRWEKFKLPQGYKLHNVPGDGLCGFWATLAALKVKEKGSAASVRVEKKEIFELLKKLADRIAQLVKKKNKTDEEQEMVCELDQLIRDEYAKNYDDLVSKLKQGRMQLDSPLAMSLAQEIGYNIVVCWEGIRAGQMGLVREQYKAKNPRETIMIYYLGNGAGGHYQAILPEGACVNFD